MRAYVTVLDGDSDLVPYFVRYYKWLGATLFPVLVFTSGDQEAELERIVGLVKQAGGIPEKVGSHPSSWFTAKRRERILRNYHTIGIWAFFVDLDEYAELTPAKVSELINTNPPYIAGHWLDRVTTDGKLTDIRPGTPLEDTYPCGTKTRRQLGYGDSAYILSPRGPHSHHPNACQWGHRVFRSVPKVPVHHFKWQGNVLRRLRLRIQRIKSMPASRPRKQWLRKVERTIEYLEHHGGGVDPTKLHLVGSKLGI